MGSQPFPTYNIPGWRWSGSALTEVGYPNAAPMYNGMTGALSLSLDPFEARVFTTSADRRLPLNGREDSVAVTTSLR